MTYGGRQPSMEDDLRWKTTFGGRQPSSYTHTLVSPIPLPLVYGAQSNMSLIRCSQLSELYYYTAMSWEPDMTVVFVLTIKSTGLEERKPRQNIDYLIRLRIFDLEERN